MNRPGELEETRRRWASLLSDPRGMRLEYVDHVDTVVVVEADGRMLARARGGPIHHMGRLSSFKARVVPAWRAKIPADRHGAMLVGLDEAAFPHGRTAAALVPDELPSFVTLELRSGERATMNAFSRSVEMDLALNRVVTELRGLARVVKAGPPTHRLPNPELDEWSSLAGSHAMADDLVPEPTADAEATAQASVDRFYAQELGSSLRRVEAMHQLLSPRVEPPRVRAAEPPAARAWMACTFGCMTTMTAAGTVSLGPSSSGGALRLSGFRPTGDVELRVPAEAWERIEAALRDSDAQTLHAFDPEIVPFYCPMCRDCYAASAWEIHQRSAWSADGVCPKGHRRRLRSD